MFQIGNVKTRVATIWIVPEAVAVRIVIFAIQRVRVLLGLKFKTAVIAKPRKISFHIDGVGVIRDLPAHEVDGNRFASSGIRVFVVSKRCVLPRVGVRTVCPVIHLAPSDRRILVVPYDFKVKEI